MTGNGVSLHFLFPFETFGTNVLHGNSLNVFFRKKDDSSLISVSICRYPVGVGRFCLINHLKANNDTMWHPNKGVLLFAFPKSFFLVSMLYLNLKKQNLIFQKEIFEFQVQVAQKVRILKLKVCRQRSMLIMYELDFN